MFSPGYLFVKVCCRSLNILKAHFNSYMPSSETCGHFVCFFLFFPYWESQRFGSPKQTLGV